MVKHAIMLTVYSDSLTMPPDKKKKKNNNNNSDSGRHTFLFHLLFVLSFCLEVTAKTIRFELKVQLNSTKIFYCHHLTSSAILKICLFQGIVVYSLYRWQTNRSHCGCKFSWRADDSRGNKKIEILTKTWKFLDNLEQTDASHRQRSRVSAFSFLFLRD